MLCPKWCVAREACRDSTGFAPPRLLADLSGLQRRKKIKRKKKKKGGKKKSRGRQAAGVASSPPAPGGAGLGPSKAERGRRPAGLGAGQERRRRAPRGAGAEAGAARSGAELEGKREPERSPDRLFLE